MRRRGKPIETDRLVVAQGWGRGKEHGERPLIGMGFFLSDENTLKLDYSDSCITL